MMPAVVVILFFLGFIGMIVYAVAVLIYASRFTGTSSRAVKAAYYRGPKWIRILHWCSWGAVCSSMLILVLSVIWPKLSE
jgi:hypothetical protein